MTEPAHRSGLVAILGRPNAGKSTLLNRLLGEKLAIVTAKPQTTRSRILGILTRPDAQLLLLDTPGMHAGERALNVALNEQVEEAVCDCDAALLLVDPRSDWDAAHAGLVERFVAHGTPVIAALTKSDLPRASETTWPPEGAGGPTAWHRISARTGEGVEALVTALVAALPEAAALYPEDQLSDRPVRFLAAELVREAAFEELAQELPYSLAVEVIEFDEKDPAITRIRANLVLERESQKPIVIGKGGSVIKRIGTRARHEIEQLLDTRVHLALWVKIEPKWQKRPNRLKSLGYS
ncbi:MAG: GTPase Era [Deltaproteobacteria bacterium]|nr:GTPase Era [Deltaproteobacteria bacterium]MBW2360414.1 GTPase Era [Deltaproteobacteria bacterium]